MIHRVILRLSLFLSAILVCFFLALHTFRYEIIATVLQKAWSADHVKIESLEGFFPFHLHAKNILLEKDNLPFFKANVAHFDVNIKKLSLLMLNFDSVVMKGVEVNLPNIQTSTKAGLSLPVFPISITQLDFEGIINGTHLILKGTVGTDESLAAFIIHQTFKGTLKTKGYHAEIVPENLPLILKAHLKDLRSIPISLSYQKVKAEGFLKQDEKEISLALKGDLTPWDIQKAELKATYQDEKITLHTLGFAYKDIPLRLENAVGINLKKGELLCSQAFFRIGSKPDLLKIENLAFGEKIQGDFSFKTKNLKDFIPLENIEGELSFQGKINGTKENPSIDAQIQAPQMKLKGLLFPLQFQGHLFGSFDKLSLESSLKGDQSIFVKSKGTFSPHHDFSIHHDISAPLKLLKPFLPNHDTLTGHIQGTLTTTLLGTQGTLGLKNIHYKNHLIGFHLQKGQGSAILKNGEIILNFQGEDDFQGRLRAKGQVSLPTFKGHCTIDLQNFYLGQSDLFTAKAHGSLHADLSQKTIKGKLTVDPVVVDIDQLTPTSTPKLFPLSGPSKKFPKKSSSSGPSPFFFDIQLVPKNFVVVRGFGIESTWEGAMSLHGHNPNFVGKFMLKKGTIDISGRILNFSRGQITFDHKIDEPLLDLEITKKIDGYHVFVQLYGRPKTPKFTFLSSPALSQEEILALIIMGRKSAASSLGQLFEVSSSLSGLSSAGQDHNIFSKFRRTFGIEALEIKKQDQTSPSESPQALSIRKTITPDVSLILEQGLSSTEEETKSSKATVEASVSENLNLEIDAATNKSTAIGFNWRKRY